jgi:hypothetical protein
LLLSQFRFAIRVFARRFPFPAIVPAEWQMNSGRAHLLLGRGLASTEITLGGRATEISLKAGQAANTPSPFNRRWQKGLTYEQVLFFHIETIAPLLNQCASSAFASEKLRGLLSLS